MSIANVPLAGWFLQRMKATSTAQGRKLLDVFDLHYYPAVNKEGCPPDPVPGKPCEADLAQVPDTNVSATQKQSATEQHRLAATRSLWDPTYVDDSWIPENYCVPDASGRCTNSEFKANTTSPNAAPTCGDAAHLMLIPRMHCWVTAYDTDSKLGAPKLGITEYDFGGLNAVNGTLALADTLGIFARERLDEAMLFPGFVPQPPSLRATKPAANAFRIFLNYDHQGHRFGETWVRSCSGGCGTTPQHGGPGSEQQKLAIYGAQRTADGALTIAVINKTDGALTGPLTLSNFTAGPQTHVYRYSGGSRDAINSSIRCRGASRCTTVRRGGAARLRPANETSTSSGRCAGPWRR